MTEDLVPPKWRELDELLEAVLPDDRRVRYQVDEAVVDAIMEAETLAAKEVGQQLLDIITGEKFGAFREARQEVAPNSQ
jgi:hypothetical protein